MRTSSKIILGILGAIILASLSIFITYKIFSNKKESNNFYAVEDECMDEEYMYETGMFDEEIEASSAEEKLSPNANLVMKKKYRGCGHITSERVELPSEMVNKTQEEIETMYKDFKVESFNKDEVVLYKEIDGICNEHYRVKEESGVITIYTINGDGKENLYDKTGISTEYLTEDDINNIKNGLEIYGKENLNKFIEDFE